MKADIQDQITSRLIEAIETGAADGKFVMPWHGRHIMPFNVASKKAYRGINTVVLWSVAQAHGYSSNLWGTYKQWEEKKAQVRKGEKSAPVVFWKRYEKMVPDANGVPEKRSVFFAKAAHVFAAEQVDGFEIPETPKGDASAIDRADTFIANTKAVIRHGGTVAAYSPSLDIITMPHRDDFLGSDTSTATEAYYSTLLHELTHWTGHKSRMDRDFSGRFGDQAYAFEELIAELGAAFACAELGVSTVPRLDHAKYLRSWLKVLRNDPKAIITAGSQASKAWAHLQGLQGIEADAEAEDVAA